jgi:hypothetical protein
MTPAMYHGHNTKPPYFEGWYYKLISADEQERYAIIPGIIFGEDAHSFVQVLDGSKGTAKYHRFPYAAFHASKKDFDVWINNSHFTSTQVDLDITTEEGTLQGKLEFENPIPWPVTWRSPGIMGWYAWVPGMECYHGVLSFDHSIHGNLTIDGEAVDFERGRGYIEKDWGKSFPSAWVWFQSNHFEAPGTCITASVAEIPFLGTSFRGFIVGLWYGGRLYRFATYTGARIEHLDIQEDHVHWVIRDRELELKLIARTGQSGLILGPTRVDMGVRVAETLQATVGVHLRTLEGEQIFSGQGRHAGLEVQGDLDRLR